MKKLLAIFLIFALALGFASCSEYEPIESTKEEARVVMTMKYGEREYELKYELYRALFLNNKSEVDGGDESVWVGDDKNTYINRINKIIINDAANIFAAFYVCDVIVDFDVYSRAADKAVEQYVKDAVEGGEGGFGHGTYDKYLAHLKEMNLNYSVQDLLYRYYIALEKIDTYYIGDVSSDNLTDDDDIALPHLKCDFVSVRDFYYSEDFGRIIYAYFSESSKKNPNFNIDSFKENMEYAAMDGDDAVRRLVGANSLAQDIDTGIFISKHTYNNEMLANINSAALALKAGEVSDIITVKGSGDDYVDGYYILYGIEKCELDFETYYTQIKLAFLGDEIGKILENHRTALVKSVSKTSEYGTVNHSKISMG